MNRKILQFTILFITVLLVMLVPFLVESGAVPIKNKALAYTIIFAFMIGISFLVSFVIKKYDEIGKTKSKRSLYDALNIDYSGNRIEYNLARAGVERKDITISTEKNKINIRIVKGIYEINLMVNTRTAELSIKYDMDEFGKLSEDSKDRISKAILEASAEPKVLVMNDKEEVYKRIIKLYKSL